MSVTGGTSLTPELSFYIYYELYFVFLKHYVTILVNLLLVNNIHIIYLEKASLCYMKRKRVWSLELGTTKCSDFIRSDGGL
jgi:hypothetical protein